MGSFMKSNEVVRRTTITLPWVIPAGAGYDVLVSNEAYEEGEVTVRRDGELLVTVTKDGEVVVHSAGLRT